jgi:CHASE3 domain sensor protein
MSGTKRADAARRWPLSRIVGVAVLALLLFSVAAVTVGAFAVLNLSHARGRVVNVLDPAAIQVEQLDNSLLNQETGVRGYALSGQLSFLAPYDTGVTEEKAAIASLRGALGQLPTATRGDLASVTAQAHYWRAHYAEAAIALVKRTGKPTVGGNVIAGKGYFDALRTKVAKLQSDISSARNHALATLSRSSSVLDAVFIAVAIGLALIVVLLALGLRATAIRPLHRLAAQVRRVADGDFEHEVTVPGPREVTHLAADVNTMRERILQELSATQEANAILQAHATELQRSNSELEQFAYVASAAAATVRGEAGRPGRSVHRVRSGRGQAHAGADQRPARLQQGRPVRARAGPGLQRHGTHPGPGQPGRADRGNRRYHRDRPPAARAGGVAAAHRGVPELAQQRAEVQRRKAAADRGHGPP